MAFQYVMKFEIITALTLFFGWPARTSPPDYSEADDKSPSFNYTCSHPIYCKSLNISTFFFACMAYRCASAYNYKHYASLRLLRSPAEIEKEGNELVAKAGGNLALLNDFLQKNFADGGEIEHWTPWDFDPTASFLRNIHNRNVKAFAISVITHWPSLGRQIVQNVSDNQDRHSLIYLPNPFIITGYDSEEWRYFDNYWILDGVLTSEMFSTAKAMLDNMVTLIQKYGFIPSGGRVYYLDRSHPPLFTKMISLYLERTKNIDWLRNNIAQAEIEVEHWIKNKFSTIRVHGRDYKLAQYKVRSHGVRPENLLGDWNMTEPVKKYRRLHLNEIKSASESAWKFSSRWIFNKDESVGPIDGRLGPPCYSNLTRIIPVDLNALLYGAFMDLSTLYKKTKANRKSLLWKQRAEELVEAIYAIHWNETDGTWYDFDIETKKHRAFFYASNLVPLWTRAYPDSSNEGTRRTMGIKAVQYLKKEKIHTYKGGIPASTIFTKEEWDFPNAFGPSQLMIVQGLWDSGDTEAVQLAHEFASKWLKTTYLGYKKYKKMFINYDVTEKGTYQVSEHFDRPIYHRVGYGWTNGVILSFVRNFAFPYGTLVSSTTTLQAMYDLVVCLLFHLGLYVYMGRILSFYF